MSSLSSALAETRVDEQRSALRALLNKPLLSASGADRADYLLVRKHSEALRTWLDLNVGWRLTVDSAIARLNKRYSQPDDGTRGLIDSNREPFTRRRYVLLALALAALERSQTQTTLGRLAEDVVASIGDPRFAAAGISYTLGNRPERSDMVAVVRQLMQAGVLTLVAGDERAFVDNSGDALYDIERRALATMMATDVGPSTVGADDFDTRLEAVLEHPSETSDELRNLATRRRLTRRLLDDPVLYYDELDESELAYLTRQRRSITDRINEATGLVAEIRAEGIAMVDPEDKLTDVRMPEAGSHGHLTLLLAEHLATVDSIHFADVVAHVGTLVTEYGNRWSKETREPGAETSLATTAINRLHRLGLVEVFGDMISPRPAIARYSVGTPTVSGGAARQTAPAAQELEFDFS